MLKTQEHRKFVEINIFIPIYPRQPTKKNKLFGAFNSFYPKSDTPYYPRKREFLHKIQKFGRFVYKLLKVLSYYKFDYPRIYIISSVITQ